MEATVTDTGPGISPDHLPYVFDRFYRGGAAHTRVGGSTGLGLASARDLARVQGGDLAVENVEDGGTAFRISLPRA